MDEIVELEKKTLFEISEIQMRRKKQHELKRTKKRKTSNTKSIKLQWKMRGYTNTRIKCIIKSRLDPNAMMSGWMRNKSFLSFYSDIYLPVKHFVHSNLVEANVLHSKMIEADASSKNAGSSEQANMIRFPPENQVEFVKTYGFEFRFFYGEVTNLFCSVFKKSLVIGNQGELVGLKMNLVISNEENLVYRKANINLSKKDKILFRQKTVKVEKDKKTKESLEAHNKLGMIAEGETQIPFSEIQSSVLSRFGNYARFRINDEFNPVHEEYSKGLTGLKSVFQKVIRSRLFFGHGWLYRTQDDSGSSQYVFQDLDGSFRLMETLKGCLRILFLFNSQTFFCQLSHKFALFDFEREKQPRALRFFSRFTAANPLFLRSMILYCSDMGNFPYIVMYSKKSGEQLRLTLLMLKNNQIFELFRVKDFYIDLKGATLHNFLIFEYKLILILETGIEVYYLNMLSPDAILLKKSEFADVGMQPILDKSVQLIRKFDTPGQDSQGFSRISLVMLVRKLDSIPSASVNSSDSTQRQEDQAKPQKGKLGVLVYDVHNPMISSFQSFIPLDSLFKRNRRGNIFTSQEEINSPIDLEDVLFFRKVPVIRERENQDKNPNPSGLAILVKVQDWKEPGPQGVQAGMDSNYLNKFSLKILFPIEPTLKLNLLKEKKSRGTQRIIQFMGVDGRASASVADKKSQSGGQKSDFLSELDPRFKLEADLFAHYQKKMQKKGEHSKDQKNGASIHKFKDSKFYQVSHSFINVLAFNNQIFSEWNKNWAFKEWKEMNTIVQSTRHTSGSVVPKKEQNSSEKQMLKEQVKDNDLQGSFENSLFQHILDEFLTPFWTSKTCENMNLQKHKTLKKKMKINPKLLFKTREFEEPEYRILKHALQEKNFIPNSFEIILDNQEESYLKLKPQDYIEGNILDVRLTVEFFPDNYHPLVSLVPVFDVHRRSSFPEKVSAHLFKQASKHRFSLTQGAEVGEYIIISKRGIHLISSSSITESLPTSNFFYGKAANLAVFSPESCLLRAVPKTNVVLCICFEESLDKMARRHAVEEVASDVEHKRKKSVSFFKLGTNRLNQPSFDHFISMLDRLDFDDLEFRDKKVLFYKKDKFGRLDIRGDFRVFDLMINWNQGSTFLSTDFRARSKSFFAKTAFKLDVLANDDQLQARVSYKNLDRYVTFELLYSESRGEAPLQKLQFFRVVNPKIVHHMTGNLNGAQLMVTPRIKNTDYLMVLFILSDLSVYSFEVNVNLFVMKPMMVEVSSRIQCKFFAAHTFDINSGFLKAAVLMNQGDLLVATQHQHDVTFALFDLLSTRHSKYLHIINQDYSRIFPKEYPKSQRVFENKILLGAFASLSNLEKDMPVNSVSVEVVFSDEIVEVHLVFDYILKIQKVPFRSELVFLHLLNNNEARTLPLDITQYKGGEEVAEQVRSGLQLVFLFAVSFLLGFFLLFSGHFESLLSTPAPSR